MFPWYSTALLNWRSRASDAQSQTHSPYEPPSYSNFDEDEARRRAQRQAMAALTGGLLQSYLSGGRDTGEAFTAQRGAYNSSLDRDLEQQRLRAYDERQQRMDASLEAARQAEIANKRVDNERAQRDAEARAAAAEAKRKADEAEQARITAQRARLLKDNPDAASYSDKQVEDEYGKRYGYHEPDKPQEISPGAYLRDPRTGKIIYHAPERPEHDKPPTPAELRAQRSEELRQIKDRADEFYDEWLASQNAYRPPSEPAKAQARLAARKRAERELRGEDDTADEPTPAVDPKAGARAVVAGAASGKPKAATAPATTAAAPNKPAKARLDAVTDAATKHKIAVARSHNYTDEQIAQFLGL